MFSAMVYCKPSGTYWLLSLAIMASVIFSGCGGNNSSLSDAPKPGRASERISRQGWPKIVAFGDSLTAGYGLDPSDSYPALLQKRLDQLGYKYEVINAGRPGDTTADGLSRIDWALKGDVRFLILELGANDGLRGLPTSQMKENLDQIIRRAKSRKVKVILAGMEAPPNYGRQYTDEFRNVFRKLAKDHQVKLIPFFLEGVAGRSELNQSDGIHPNAEGMKLVMENVWRALEPMLQR
jgi:acyl-CoA thioesterase-1